MARISATKPSSFPRAGDCFVATLLAMTGGGAMTGKGGVGAKPLPCSDAQQSESDEPPPESDPPVSPPGSDHEPLSPPDGSGWSQVPWSTAPWSGAVLVSQVP